MRQRNRRIALGALLAVAVTAGAPPPTAAGGKLFSRTRTVFRVEIRPLSASIPGDDESGIRVVEFRSEREGRIAFPIAWPDEDRPSRIEFALREAPPSTDAKHALAVEASLHLAGGRTVRAERNLTFDDRTTGLFEVYRVSGRVLTFAVDVAAERETVYSATPPIGRPFGFRLEIVRVEGDRTASLESNDLTTFVGEPVGYSFRLGDAATADAVEIRLRPVRVLDSIAEVEVELSGSLPGENGLEMIGRTERLVVSRGSSATVAVEYGRPPTGYRFVITPHF